MKNPAKDSRTMKNSTRLENAAMEMTIKEKRKDLNTLSSVYDFKDEFVDNQLDVLEKWLNYRELKDVDCDSSLLATILFNEMWDYNSAIRIQNSSKNKYQLYTQHFNLRGDSMTSLFTSFKKYMQLFHSDLLDKGEVPNHKQMTGTNTEKWIQFLRDIKHKLQLTKEMREFIVLYNTVGNMLPVPILEGYRNSSFNTSRSNYGKYDYVDLMLTSIYHWFTKNNVHATKETDDTDLNELLGYNAIAVRCCKMWLTDFGSWELFVKGNYLQDFIDEMTQKPILLWKGHSFQHPIPRRKEEMNEFLSNVNAMIKKRGDRMLNQK